MRVRLVGVGGCGCKFGRGAGVVVQKMSCTRRPGIEKTLFLPSAVIALPRSTGKNLACENKKSTLSVLPDLVNWLITSVGVLWLPGGTWAAT